MRIDSTGNVNIYGTDNRPLAITSFATVSAGAGWDLNATSGNGVVTVSTGGTERMRIGSSGIVTIGTLTSGNTGQLIVNQEGGATPVAKFMSRTNRAIVQVSDNDTTGYISSENAVFSIGRSAGSSANNINIDTSNNVGIGTTSPTSKVSISKDDNTTNDLDVLNLKRVWTSATSTDRSHGIKFSDTNATLANIYADRTNSASNYNGDLVFVTNSGASATNTSEKMRITSAGNVGIGTDSPDQLLHLQSTSPFLSISHTNDNGTSGILFRRTDNNQNRGTIVYDFANDAMTFRASTNGTGEDMRINSSGNVGIGTTNPIFQLHVVGNSYIDADSNSANLTLGRYSGQPNIKAGGDDGGYLIMDSTGGDAALNWYVSDNVILANGGGNVGIGTDSPTAHLQVISTSTSQSTAYFYSNATKSAPSVQIWQDGAASTGQALLIRNDGTGNSLQIDDTTAGNAVFVVDSDGNVGIGTASPSYKLEVNGNAEFLDNVNIKSNSYDDYQIAVDSVGFSIYNRTDAAYNMTIDHTGNVGIGTIYPASLGGGAKLSVNQAADGNIVFARGGSTRQVQIGTTSTTGYINADNTSGGLTFNVNTTERMRIDSSGQITNTMSGGKVLTDTNGHITSFQTLDTQTAGGRFIGKSNRGVLGSIHIEQTTTGADGGYIGFETSPNGSTTPTERMRIDSIGRVGIGETNPDRELDLKNSADNCIISITSSASHLSGLVLGDTADDDRGGILYNNTSDYLYFLSNAQERMRIDSSGTIIGTGTYTAGNSIKIFEAQRSGGAVASDWSYDDATTDMSLGTSTAHSFSFKTGGTRALTIDTSGQVYFKSSSDYKIGLNDSAGTNQWWLKSYTNGDFALHENGAGDQFTIQAGGNVGINDPTPSASLSIISNDANIIDLSRQNVGTYRLAISSTDKFSVFDVGANTDRLVIDSSGKVGIGTTSPGRKLHLLDGQIKFENTGTGGWAGLDFAMGNGTYDGYMGMLDSDGRFFIDVDSNGEDFTILQNGNVGIGTTDPKELLHIYQQGTVSNYYDEGALQIGGPSTSYGALLSYHGSSSGRVSLSSLYNTGGANATLSFGFGGINTSGRPTNEVLTVNQAGNVGIGTLNPASMLNINTTGTANYGLKLSRNDSATDGFEFTYTPSSAEAFIENKYPTSSGQVYGDIRFRTNQGGTQTTSMTIKADGNYLQVSNGITFGSDTANANRLDDYEEGTFTPQIHAGASNPSFNSNNYGKYTKIGNVVHCSGRFSVNSITAGSSGTSVELGGFPFVASTPLGDSIGAIAGSIGFATGFANESPTMMQIRDNETNALLYYQNSSLGISNLKGNDFGTDAHSIVFQITYHV